MRKSKPPALSQIPYKDRLLYQKFQTVKEHRDDAAKTALLLACVALNETEGLGYKRLVRFATELQKLIDEYYDDTELGQAHLENRMRSLGFAVVDGHILAVMPEEDRK